MIRPLNLTVPEGVSLKDPALVRNGDTVYLFCSWFYEDNFCRLSAWQSSDLEHWEGPLWTWGEGDKGYCSPDVIRVEDRWIMTFQSWDAIHPRQSRNQVFYSISEDLINWSDPRPLAQNLTKGKRAIDAALAHHEDRWYLIYKEAQEPRLATAHCLDGPWEMLPPPVDHWMENAQLLRIDGHWNLYATLENHVQGIARMRGDGSQPSHWSDWEPFKRLNFEITPGFNRAIPANAGYLWDDRMHDGHWILTFCSADQPPRSNLDYRLGIQFPFLQLD